MTADSAVPPTTDSDEETIKRRIFGALVDGKTGFTFGDANAWEAARILAPLVAAEVAAARADERERCAKAIEAWSTDTHASFILVTEAARVVRGANHDH